MQLVYKDVKKRTIKGREEITFFSFSSFHLIAITARTKGERQRSKEASDDEDLTVAIDGRDFPQISSSDSQRRIDSPAAFSGGELHNLAKTVYFLIYLKGRSHTIILSTDKDPHTATFESMQVYAISTLHIENGYSLQIENQAEDGDRRPWITFALDSIPLKSFTPSVTYHRREKDSDDVKIIVDGQRFGNILKGIKHFLWRYAGSLLPKLFPTKTEVETFIVNLPTGLHYLEFESDRMPTLHFLTLEFGDKPTLPVGIPTVDNPKWTGDFYDDTPDILLARMILGEAEGAIFEIKTAVGWTVKNRILARRASEWGSTYHEVILKSKQYEAFAREERLIRLKDPLSIDETGVREAWFDCYKAARGILDGTIVDTSKGATNYYSTPIKTIPSWATSERKTVEIENVLFFKL